MAWQIAFWRRVPYDDFRYQIAAFIDLHGKCFIVSVCATVQPEIAAAFNRYTIYRPMHQTVMQSVTKLSAVLPTNRYMQ